MNDSRMADAFGTDLVENILNVDIDKTIYKKDTVKLLLYFKDNKKIRSNQLKIYPFPGFFTLQQSFAR